MLGTSLLFWGAMTDRPLIALMLALLVEARHWTRFRWEFDDDACGRAWQFTSIAIALAAVLIWLDGNRYTALPGLLSWMRLRRLRRPGTWETWVFLGLSSWDIRDGPKRYT